MTTKAIRIGIVSDAQSELMRLRALSSLQDALPGLVDINKLLGSSTDGEITQGASQMLLANELDFVCALSWSGNAFQMVANKNEGINAVVIPDIRFVADMVSEDSRMIEMASAVTSLESVVEICTTVFELKQLRT